MSTVTRHIGNCQICERDQKVQSGVMVLHGYKRPGFGCNVGHCPGDGKAPYEQSCEALKGYVAELRSDLDAFAQRIEAIQTGTVAYVVSFGRFNGQRREYVAGVTEPAIWYGVMGEQVRDIEYRVRATKSEIARCEKRIAAWEPKPVRTVEEEQEKAAKASAERKAEREAARAAKAAKRAALDAKHAAREAERKAIREGFEARLVALAASPASPERDAVARKVIAEMDKAKYANWLSKWDLNRNPQVCAAVVTLGLATVDGQTGHNPPRPYLRWH